MLNRFCVKEQLLCRGKITSKNAELAQKVSIKAVGKATVQRFPLRWGLDEVAHSVDCAAFCQEVIDWIPIVAAHTLLLG